LAGDSGPVTARIARYSPLLCAEENFTAVMLEIPPEFPLGFQGDEGRFAVMK